MNMFRQVVCDVAGVLKPGTNEIRILFESPTAYTAREAKRYAIARARAPSSYGRPESDADTTASGSAKCSVISDGTGVFFSRPRGSRARLLWFALTRLALRPSSRAKSTTW